MKKAASVFLRAQITAQDVDLLIQWLEDPQVTRYLNEESCAADELRSLLRSVPEPLYGMRLSREGRFCIACGEDGSAVGFVRLVRCGAAGEYEIVFAVGRTQLWGNGYGSAAVRAAVNTAFFELRASRIIANIYAENLRSMAVVRACGFVCERADGPLHRYVLTDRMMLDALLHR